MIVIPSDKGSRHEVVRTQQEEVVMTSRPVGQEGHCFLVVFIIELLHGLAWSYVAELKTNPVMPWAWATVVVSIRFVLPEVQLIQKLNSESKKVINNLYCITVWLICIQKNLSCI